MASSSSPAIGVRSSRSGASALNVELTVLPVTVRCARLSLASLQAAGGGTASGICDTLSGDAAAAATDPGAADNLAAALSPAGGGTVNAELCFSVNGRNWRYLAPGKSFIPLGGAGGGDSCSVFGA